MASLLRTSRGLHHATRLQPSTLLQHHIPTILIPPQRRLYHQTPSSRQPYKDDQDRESLKPRSHEGSKGASDSDIASNFGTSFTPKATDPENESKKAKQEAGGGEEDPLELSGANQELSKPPASSGEKGGEKKRRSGPGGPPKRGKPT